MPSTPNQRSAGAGCSRDFRIYDLPMPEHLAKSTSTAPVARSAGVWALIPSAGQGSRAATASAVADTGQPPRVPGLAKQYQTIAGKPIVAHTVDAFWALGPALSGVCVAVAPDDQMFEAVFPGFAGAGGHLLRCGGITRADTVENALASLVESGLAQADDWVLVHDAARCLITSALIASLIEACRADALGGLLAQPLADTLKSGSSEAGSVSTRPGSRVLATVARTDKWLAQTPQMFRVGPLRSALAEAARLGLQVTDESSAMEAAGGSPLLVPGSALNFKVTYPEDFSLAEAVLRGRQR